MNEVFSAALQLHEFCEHQGWRFCLIGGVAVHRWGEQRTTDDVDLTLLTGFGNEEVYRDWTDVEGVLIRQWQTIDLEQVRQELKPLAELKESPEILERLEQQVRKLNQSAVLSKLRRQ